MNNSSDKIRAIYKSRSTLLELLDAQGYEVEDYVEFSLNEVDAMFNNDQLDMLLTHKDNGKKHILNITQMEANCMCAK